MKIAIIRGPALTQYDMETYEPLARTCDVVAYYSNDYKTKIDEINLPKKKLTSLEGIFGRQIYRFFDSLLGPWNILDLPFRVVGYCHHMIGLEEELKSMDIANVIETYHAFSYQAIMAKKKYGVKVVVTAFETNPFFCEFPFPNHKRKIKESVRKNADLFVAITGTAREALIYEGVPEEKIVVIPSTVDIDLFKPRKKDGNILKSFGLNDNDFVILFIGRLEWEKGVYDIIYAAKRLLLDPELKHKSFKFVFVGGGDELKGMKKLIKKLNIANSVILKEKLPRKNIPVIYNLADVFVTPSIPMRNWQEQFGIVFTEAMASGCPIIAGASGAIPEVIGDAGILVQPNDPYSIYKEIKKLALNDELREHYRNLARARAENVYNPEKVAARIKEEYEKLL